MDIISILLIAIGLSMDAFAVAVANGVASKRMTLKIDTALIMGLFFGGFQIIMPIIGWFAGIGLRHFIAGIDHWFAFFLLIAIGGKMIYESFESHDRTKETDAVNLSLAMLFVLAIATSIDALAVGLSISFLQISIWLPAIIIGLVTFSLSFIGVRIGKRVGHFLKNRAEFVGGLILIGIGVKIVLEHLH